MTETSTERLQRTQALDAALTRRDELHAALVRLERALASPSPSPEWVPRIRSELEGLRGVLDVHIEVTEGGDGLFEEVVRAAPRLCHQVDVMKAEHLEISAALDGALAAAGAAADAETLRENLLGLLAHLVRHRQKGADLLYEAYDVDLGGQG